jgi:hypothetical protein
MPNIRINWIVLIWISQSARLRCHWLRLPSLRCPRCFRSRRHCLPILRSRASNPPRLAPSPERPLPAHADQGRLSDGGCSRGGDLDALCQGFGACGNGARTRVLRPTNNAWRTVMRGGGPAGRRTSARNRRPGRTGRFEHLDPVVGGLRGQHRVDRGCKWLRLSCRRLRLTTSRRAFRKSGGRGSFVQAVDRSSDTESCRRGSGTRFAVAQDARRDDPGLTRSGSREFRLNRSGPEGRTDMHFVMPGHVRGLRR